MAILELLRKGWVKYKAISLRKRVLYTTILILWHILLLIVAVFSNRFQRNLQPLADKMDRMPESWLILSALLVIVSIPPLFGHELLAVIAGYVYGATMGFLILTISSIVGESAVYFAFRYWLRQRIDAFRQQHHKNYGVFVAVVDDGGVLMLWLIRMSVIPPHFSTPLFSSLNNITWWKWMLANICASPVKFFPPVFIGTLLRDKRHNSIFGDLAFAVSTIVTIGVLWHIRRDFLRKKQELRDIKVAEELSLSQVSASRAQSIAVSTEKRSEEEDLPVYETSASGLARSLTISKDNTGDATAIIVGGRLHIKESSRQCVVEFMTGSSSSQGYEMTTLKQSSNIQQSSNITKNDSPV